VGGPEYLKGLGVSLEGIGVSIQGLGVGRFQPGEGIGVGLGKARQLGRMLRDRGPECADLTGVGRLQPCQLGQVVGPDRLEVDGWGRLRSLSPA
jgi:hypothetical protein